MIDILVKNLIINYDMIFFTVIGGGNMFTISYPNIKKKIILQRDKNGCFPCISHRLDNYGYCGIKINYRMIKMHRLVYCLFNDKQLNQIKGVVIRHLCGNRSCSNPDHLMTGTYEENAFDRKIHDTETYGERNGSAKLNDIIVMCIRDPENYMPNEYYAEKYNVTVKAIRDIKQGRTWKHLL